MLFQCSAYGGGGNSEYCGVYTGVYPRLFFIGGHCHGNHDGGSGVSDYPADNFSGGENTADPADASYQQLYASGGLKRMPVGGKTDSFGKRHGKNDTVFTESIPWYCGGYQYPAVPAYPGD